MTPVQVAAEVLNVPSSQLTATRIKGGLTNESWCVQAPHTAVVVRISTVDEHALQLNRHSEAQALALAQQAGIGAEVLLCEPERRLLVTRLIDAQTLSLEAMRTDGTIDQVAQLLRQLHALPAPAGIQMIDLAATLRGYWRSLEGQWSADDTKARLHEMEIAMEIAMESTRSALRCLCHNDVHHLNVLSNNQRLWLLDWEYAGIGDPFFDLAAVCCYHAYNETLRDRLLVAYLGHVDAADHLRLQRMCWLFDYIKELWLAVRQPQDAVEISSAAINGAAVR